MATRMVEITDEEVLGVLNSIEAQERWRKSTLGSDRLGKQEREATMSFRAKLMGLHYGPKDNDPRQ